MLLTSVLLLFGTESDIWRGRAGDRGTGGPDGSMLPYLDQDDNLDPQREHMNNDQLSGSPPREKVNN